ncbi:MAG: transposase [Richelia sp.]|nr:transposase [Richelia sp.]
MVFGLLCNDKGCPIAVEVFEVNTSDPKTFINQIDQVSSRFGIKRVVWVRDCGMITQGRIREDLKEKEGLDWISALRASGSNQ